MGIKKPLTPKEVSDILGCHLFTVYKLIRTRELPAYHVGRHLRVDPDDLNHFAQKNKLQAA